MFVFLGSFLATKKKKKSWLNNRPYLHPTWKVPPIVKQVLFCFVFLCLFFVFVALQPYRKKLTTLQYALAIQFHFSAQKLTPDNIFSKCDSTQPNEADVGNKHSELGKQMCSKVKIYQIPNGGLALKTIAVNKVTNRWRNHNNKTTKIYELNKIIELYEL